MVLVFILHAQNDYALDGGRRYTWGDSGVILFLIYASWFLPPSGM